MANIHFVLQGKGGVGKSFVASILYQYLQKKGLEVSGYDTDPVNSSFVGYREFHNITEIDILKGNKIDESKFDVLIESIYRKSADEHVVIDNGAATFMPLCDYMTENDGFELLEQYGHTVFLHVVITGGQALADTLDGFQTLVDNFSRPVIVWLNPYFGEVGIKGIPFEDFEIFEDYHSQILALVKLPEYASTVIKHDMEELLTNRNAFESYINSSEWLMPKHRIKKYWQAIVDAIDRARLI